MKKCLIYLLVLLTLLFSACGKVINEEGNNNEPIKTKATLLNNVEDPKGEISSFDFLDQNGKLVEKINNFSIDLTLEYLKNYKGNDVISPISVYMALAMAYEVLDEDMKANYLNGLGLTESDLSKTRDLVEVLTNTTLYDHKEVSKSLLTNSIWFDSDNSYEYNKDILDRLSKYYYCHAMQAPFQTDNAKANKLLKDFVADKTNDLIKKDFDLSPNTVSVIVNTLYLKDMWTDEGFLKVEENLFNDVKKDFIVGKYHVGKVYKDTNYSTFYTETYSGYKIHILMPNKGVDLFDVLSSKNIKDMLERKYVESDDKAKEKYYTRVIMPKFEATSDIDFKEILTNKYNLGFIFDEFTSPLVNDRVYFSGVNHSAILKVDETGIEGAAVTYMPMATKGLDPYQEVFLDYVLNYSFFFVITDEAEISLFSGVVTK